MLGTLCNHWTTADKIRRRLIGCTISIAVVAWGISTAQSQTLTPIRVSGSDAISAATPFFAAETQGFFKDAGLDVTYVTMSGGDTPMAAALKAAELDVGLGAAAQYMGDIARGVMSGKIIGELTDNNYLILGRTGITDVKQLKGKIFGISSYDAGDQFYAEAVLSHYGIGPDEVTWLPVGAPASRMSALRTAKVDGIEMPSTSLPPDSGTNNIIVTADDSPVPFVSDGIFVRQPFLTSNKPALQKFLAAIGKGSDWIRAHPDEAVKSCMLSGTSDATCKVAIQVATSSKSPYSWSSTGRINLEAVKAMVPMVAAGIPQAKGLTLDDFVDTSIAGDGP